MAKTKAEEKALNLDQILFNCRDYLRAARNSVMSWQFHRKTFSSLSETHQHP